MVEVIKDGVCYIVPKDKAEAYVKQGYEVIEAPKEKPAKEKPAKK